jgi:hypothetical protein
MFRSPDHKATKLPLMETQLKQIKDECLSETKQKDVDPTQSRIHPVPGYSDLENMWVKLCNIEKQEPPTNKY